MFEFVGGRLGVTTFQPERMFEAGDAVIAVVAVEGTVPTTGKRWGGMVAQQFTFGADGKVVAFHDYQDSWGVAAALESTIPSAPGASPNTGTSFSESSHTAATEQTRRAR